MNFDLFYSLNSVVPVLYILKVKCDASVKLTKSMKSCDGFEDHDYWYQDGGGESSGGLRNAESLVAAADHEFWRIEAWHSLLYLACNT